jgi:RNA 2',3'-cyclic 3'-phosphodiesterase
MRGQLSFDGIDGSPQPTSGVYFALLPVVDAARLIAWRRRHLCCEHGLNGKPIAAGRLHVSVHHLGDYAAPPPGIVAAARDAAAAASVVMPPFELVFDRVVSFENRSGRHPLVLQGTDGVAELVAFRRVLGTAMQKAGLWRWVKLDYLPHLTLLYDDRRIAEQAVEAVGWTVQEFVLVHSLYGQARYDQLGRWPLRG